MILDGLWYLATPYSAPSPEIEHQRFEQACQLAGELMHRGMLILSPIAHTHPIAITCAHELPRGWDFWQKYDQAILGRCDGLLVAMMSGWRESKGVQAEIAFAQSCGLPIRFLVVADLTIVGIPTDQEAAACDG